MSVAFASMRCRADERAWEFWHHSSKECAKSAQVACWWIEGACKRWCTGNMLTQEGIKGRYDAHQLQKVENVKRAQTPETKINPDKKVQDVERDAHQGGKGRKSHLEERHKLYTHMKKKSESLDLLTSRCKSKNLKLHRQRNNCSLLECCIDMHILKFNAYL